MDIQILLAEIMPIIQSAGLALERLSVEDGVDHIKMRLEIVANAQGDSSITPALFVYVQNGSIPEDICNRWKNNPETGPLLYDGQIALYFVVPSGQEYLFTPNGLSLMRARYA